MILETANFKSPILLFLAEKKKLCTVRAAILDLSVLFFLLSTQVLVFGTKLAGSHFIPQGAYMSFSDFSDNFLL